MILLLLLLIIIIMIIKVDQDVVQERGLPRAEEAGEEVGRHLRPMKLIIVLTTAWLCYFVYSFIQRAA